MTRVPLPGKPAACGVVACKGGTSEGVEEEAVAVCVAQVELGVADVGTSMAGEAAMTGAVVVVEGNVHDEPVRTVIPTVACTPR